MIYEKQLYNLKTDKGDIISEAITNMHNACSESEKAICSGDVVSYENTILICICSTPVIHQVPNLSSMAFVSVGYGHEGFFVDYENPTTAMFYGFEDVAAMHKIRELTSLEKEKLKNSDISFVEESNDRCIYYGTHKKSVWRVSEDRRVAFNDGAE